MYIGFGIVIFSLTLDSRLSHVSWEKFKGQCFNGIMSSSYTGEISVSSRSPIYFCDIKYCTVMVRLYILLQSLSVHCIILLCVIASVVNLKQCLYLNLHNLQYINISTDTKVYRMPEKMTINCELHFFLLNNAFR